MESSVRADLVEAGRRMYANRLVVARDGRTSANAMRDALVEGLISSGRDVVDIGQVPTPVLYFATHFLDTGSGVMVTGSHNPPNYNGLKIMLGGETLFGDAIQKLYQRAVAGEFPGKVDRGQRNQGKLDAMIAKAFDELQVGADLEIHPATELADELGPDEQRLTPAR